MTPRLTKVQREYLRFLAESKILRGCGSNPACHKLRLLGLATIQWIGPREYAYTVTRAGETLNSELKKKEKQS